MTPRRKPLHVLQLVVGLAMFPLGVWFFMRGEYLGVCFALIAGALTIAYTVVNLFVRPWP